MLEHKRRCFLEFGVLSLLTPFTLRAEQPEGLCVVVGTKSRVEELSLEQLRDVFTRQPQYASLIPLNHPARTKFREVFDRRVLGMTPEQVADYWIQRRRRREPGPPRSVPSLATLRRVLSRLPNTVGYLPRRQLSNQVRVLRVEGKYPEELGYPVLLD